MARDATHEREAWLEQQRDIWRERCEAAERIIETSLGAVHVVRIPGAKVAGASESTRSPATFSLGGEPDDVRTFMAEFERGRDAIETLRSARRYVAAHESDPQHLTVYIDSLLGGAHTSDSDELILDRCRFALQPDPDPGDVPYSATFELLDVKVIDGRVVAPGRVENVTLMEPDIGDGVECDHAPVNHWTQVAVQCRRCGQTMGCDVRPRL